MSSNDSRGGRHASNARATGQQRQNAASVETSASHRKVNKPTQPNNSTNATPSPVQIEPISLPTFNVEDVEKLLLRGVSQQAQLYTPPTSQQPSQGKSSAWGTRAGAMANGRDFWLELRKQVTALRQSGGVSQGG